MTDGNIEQLRANIRAVHERVAAACRRSDRDPGEVTIVAAAKYIDAVTVERLAGAGIAHVAENRLQSLVDKQTALPQLDVCWHYIGRLQSRKAVDIASRSDVVHSLCSMSAARRLAAADTVASPEDAARLLVQVNIDGDPGKDGVAPGELEQFLRDLPAELQIDGLMTMPAFTEDPEGSRPAFARLRGLRDQLQPRFSPRHRLAWLSMGTSQDYEVAVEEGATHIRLGRILYAVQE